MHPIIFQFGPLTIYSYGVMLAIAVVVCTFLVSTEARRLGFNPDVIFDIVFWIVLFGILGARIFYILLNLEFFLENPLETIMIQKGGLAWQGSLIAGGLVGVWLIQKRRLPLFQMLDLFAPYIALGQAIGRIGCFLNGCCFGREVPWGIYFPVHDAHLHPTQIYESLGLLIVFAAVRLYQGISKIEGSVFVFYLILASLLRFIVEFFRGDHELVWGNLSLFQFICLGIILAALFMGWKIRKKGK